MFDSLEEQIQKDDAAVSSTRERVMIWLAVGVISLLVFAGLFVGVSLLE